MQMNPELCDCSVPAAVRTGWRMMTALAGIFLDKRNSDGYFDSDKQIFLTVGFLLMFTEVIPQIKESRLNAFVYWEKLSDAGRGRAG